jgi:hypothetical protein
VSSVDSHPQALPQERQGLLLLPFNSTCLIMCAASLFFVALQALPQDRQGLLLVQQQAVLEALTAALVRRTQLSPAAAAAATADARDLPEEMRMVRWAPTATLLVVLMWWH